MDQEARMMRSSWLGSAASYLRKEPSFVVCFLWAALWLFACLASRDWIPGLLWISVLPALVALAAGVCILVAMVAKLLWLLLKRRATASALFSPLLLIILYWLIAQVPSRPAVIFYLNRQTFIEATKEAVTAYQATGDYDFPDGAPLQGAGIYTLRSRSPNIGVSQEEAKPPMAIIVEYCVADFYLPLVYISTDRPEDAYDTCSAGGVPIERLQPNWYVCARDWN